MTESGDITINLSEIKSSIKEYSEQLNKSSKLYNPNKIEKIPEVYKLPRVNQVEQKISIETTTSRYLMHNHYASNKEKSRI